MITKEQLTKWRAALQHHVDQTRPITSSVNALAELQEQLTTPGVFMTKVEDFMPPNETDVLCELKDGTLVVLYRKLEDDGFEATYRPFWFWCHPDDDGRDYEGRVVAWMYLKETKT